MAMPDPPRVKREISEDRISKAQVSIAFADVTMSFSLKEWLNLDEWEKELYKKVITEIHETMSLKGYIIANPGIVFRIKSEEQQLGLNDCLDLNEKRFSSPVKPSISSRPRKVTQPEFQELPESEASQGASNPTPNNPIFHPNLSLWIKEMEDPCMRDEHREERLSIPTPRNVAERRTLTAETGEEYGATSAKQSKEFNFSEKITKENVLAFDGGGSQARRTYDNLIKDRLVALPDCRKMFGTISGPVVPTETIEKSKPFRCKVCAKSFGKKSNLIIHERTHTGEKPFKCPQCDKGFNHKSNLNQHQTTHTGERPFQCTLCEKRFSHKVSRNLHQRTHTGERPYRCSLCAKCFSRNSHLIQHLKTHSGEKRRGWMQRQNDGWQLSQELFQDASLDIMDVTLDIPPVELGTL
ncbi:zinc finger protein 569-like isoform X2 [Ambystoma mexicanum]|uniref:zinc finger protein 569-like isoform X2 n=1 Tax=Ambystoma mexicanum TaxID=8296 RepID=UPI0037E75806